MSARNVNLKATEQRRITHYYDHPSSCCRHEKSCLCSTWQICADILHILVIMTWSLVYSLCTWLVHAIYNILYKLTAIKLFVYWLLKSYRISLIWLLFARLGDITWCHLSLFRPFHDDFNYMYILHPTEEISGVMRYFSTNVPGWTGNFCLEVQYLESYVPGDKRRLRHSDHRKRLGSHEFSSI